MVARFRYSGITDSSIDLLIMVVISGRSWASPFVKSQMGSGSKLRDLYAYLVINLFDLNSMGWSKYFPI